MWKILCCAALFGVFVPPISTQKWDLDNMTRCSCADDAIRSFSASVANSTMKKYNGQKSQCNETLDGAGATYKLTLMQGRREDCNTFIQNGSPGKIYIYMNYFGELNNGYPSQVQADTKTGKNKQNSANLEYTYTLDVSTGILTETSAPIAQSEDLYGTKTVNKDTNTVNTDNSYILNAIRGTIAPPAQSDGLDDTETGNEDTDATDVEISYHELDMELTLKDNTAQESGGSNDTETGNEDTDTADSYPLDSQVEIGNDTELFFLPAGDLNDTDTGNDTNSEDYTYALGANPGIPAAAQTDGLDDTETGNEDTDAADVEMSYHELDMELTLKDNTAPESDDLNDAETGNDTSTADSELSDELDLVTEILSGAADLIAQSGGPNDTETGNEDTDTADSYPLDSQVEIGNDTDLFFLPAGDLNDTDTGNDTNSEDYTYALGANPGLAAAATAPAAQTGGLDDTDTGDAGTSDEDYTYTLGANPGIVTAATAPIAQSGGLGNTDTGNDDTSDEDYTYTLGANPGILKATTAPIAQSGGLGNTGTGDADTSDEDYTYTLGANSGILTAATAPIAQSGGLGNTGTGDAGTSNEDYTYTLGANAGIPKATTAPIAQSGGSNGTETGNEDTDNADSEDSYPSDSHVAISNDTDFFFQQSEGLDDTNTGIKPNSANVSSSYMNADTTSGSTGHVPQSHYRRKRELMPFQAVIFDIKLVVVCSQNSDASAMRDSINCLMRKGLQDYWTKMTNCLLDVVE